MIKLTTGNWRPARDERVLALARALPLPAVFPRPDIVFWFVYLLDEIVKKYLKW